MEGTKSIRRPNEWKNDRKYLAQIVDDAWGPPGTTGHKSTGTTPISTSTTPLFETSSTETEEEYAEYYQDRINESHNKQLYPLMEDLSDWMNKTLDVEYLQGTNLLDLLDNGVLLCQLAKIIQEKAEIAVSVGSSSPPVPTISARCFKTAARRSFFSRDNMEKFIQFCKKLGVHENLLFESDDLVLQSNPRNVILCLMEVSRLATRFGIEPPGLVKFEREIAEQEKREELAADREESQLDCNFLHRHTNNNSTSSWNLDEPIKLSVKHGRNCSSTAPTPTSDESRYEANVTSVTPASSVQNLRTNDHGTLRRATSEGARMNGVTKSSVKIRPKNKLSNGSSHRIEQPWPRDSGDNGTHSESDTQSNDDLDKKVQRATHFIRKHCRCAHGKCEKLTIKKIGEGKYTIGGRNVFIRLLKGRHMMVRVGGGWDTLENFLIRHDPCQSFTKSVSRTNSPLPSKNNVRRYSNTSQYRGSPVDSLISR